MRQLKKFGKWILYILGGLIGLLILLIIISTINVNSRANKVYEISAPPLTIPTDAESLQRGEHLVKTRGCFGCHGEDFSGQVFIDIPLLGTIYSSNLTAGKGGVGSVYSEQDFVNAIRYGVKNDGTPLLLMPSNEYWILNDEDVAQIVAYLQTVEPVDRENPDSQMGILGKLFILFNVFPGFSVELIDLDGPRPEPVEAAATVEYGQQLATFCKGCHGQTYSGGPIPGAPSDMTPPANITTGGRVGNWSLNEFIQMMRTGVSPEGDKISEEMPWKELGEMNDIELEAIYLFLQSLPPLEYGNR